MNDQIKLVASSFSPYCQRVEICMLPAFKPLTTIDNNFALEIFDNFPNVAAYAKNLITRHLLKEILPKNYNDSLNKFLVAKNSYLLKIKL
jgi:hypothetical protein